MSNKKRPFNTEKLIFEKISEDKFKTYIVDFDIDGFRYKELAETLMDVIIEFSFGLIKGDVTENNKLIQRVRDAANLIYDIEGYDLVRDFYLKESEDIQIEKKYENRGEFGEIILHLLLREFHNTIPLLAKMYFKDSLGMPVHGFDGVHIDPENKTLWLGESKLYSDGENGVKKLIEDIEEHLNSDYLRKEFFLISNKLDLVQDIPDKDFWLELMSKRTKLEDIFDSVKIPLVCTYSSPTYQKHTTNCQSFHDEIIEECEKLNDKFLEKKIPTPDNLKIILILFPIPCKKELVKIMHKKLTAAQSI